MTPGESHGPAEHGTTTKTEADELVHISMTCLPLATQPVDLMALSTPAWRLWLTGYASGYAAGLPAGRRQEAEEAEATFRRAVGVVGAMARLDSDDDRAAARWRHYREAAARQQANARPWRTEPQTMTEPS